MDQWITARVRAIKNVRDLFKKKENLGFLDFDPGRIHFFGIFGGSYAPALYFDAVSIMSYFVFTNSKIWSRSPCFVKGVAPLMFETLKRVGVNNGAFFVDLWVFFIPWGFLDISFSRLNLQSSTHM